MVAPQVLGWSRRVEYHPNTVVLDQLDPLHSTTVAVGRPDLLEGARVFALRGIKKHQRGRTSAYAAGHQLLVQMAQRRLVY